MIRRTFEDFLENFEDYRNTLSRLKILAYDLDTDKLGVDFAEDIDFVIRRIEYLIDDSLVLQRFIEDRIPDWQKLLKDKGR